MSSGLSDLARTGDPVALLRELVSVPSVNPVLAPDERVRTYTSIGALSDEMIEARILAGIHFRTADRDGDRLGRQVAQFALTHVLRRTY